MLRAQRSELRRFGQLADDGDVSVRLLEWRLLGRVHARRHTMLGREHPDLRADWAVADGASVPLESQRDRELLDEPVHVRLQR